MNALTLLTVLALAQAPSYDLKKLEQVLELAGPDRAAAEQALRADPKAAGPLLSYAVRLAGPGSLQDVLRERLECPFMMMGGPRFEPAPTSAAAGLLLSLAGADEQVRVQLATSGHGLDKLIAVASVWDDDAALQKLSGQLEAPALAEGERRLLMSLKQCAVMRRRGRPGGPLAALAKLASSATKRGTCDDERGAAALIAAGPFELRGWGSSGKNFTFRVEANGVSTEASGSCLLATYAPLQQKGDASAVLLPLVESRSPWEKEALSLLQRDLERYPKDSRRKALRLLLSRGLLVDRLAEFTPDERRNDPALLRPWLLSGDPAAQAHLFSRLACPFNGDEVPTLTVLKDRRLASTEAHRLAETCPRSRAAAMVVLRELKDPKWLKYAPLAVSDPFAKSELETVLTDSWSPALAEELLSVRSKDEAFLQWRDELIRRAAPRAPR
ncbi:MAG: hypothetical protein Q8L48_30560 [Archangium sp.]|nr:hypothetical protein [Archangium sp.]